MYIKYAVHSVDWEIESCGLFWGVPFAYYGCQGYGSVTLLIWMVTGRSIISERLALCGAYEAGRAARGGAREWGNG